MRLYARHDNQVGAKPFEVSEIEAIKLNKNGFGIFQLVNEFNGRRLKENLTRVNYWYVEIDYDGKKIELEKLLDIFLIPTLVVETKSGYHVYFKAKEASLNLDTYRIIELRLREVFAGDENAVDVARLLRAPGFNHMKDPNAPFLCHSIIETDAEYTESAMLALLPKCQKENQEEAKTDHQSHSTYAGQDDFKVWIDQQNQKDLLSQLSGSYLVCGDTFSFHSTTGHRFNTVTNGKPSAWFIDDKGMIGSNRGGGPTVVQFVQFYGVYTSYKEVLERLKEFFRR